MPGFTAAMFKGQVMKSILMSKKDDSNNVECTQFTIKEMKSHDFC